MRLKSTFPFIEIGGGKGKKELAGLYNSAFPRANRYALQARDLSAIQAASRGLVFKCIDERAKAIAGVPYRAYQMINQTTKRELPLNHWLVKLLRNPNPIYTFEEFAPLIGQWLDINGNVFLYAPRFGNPYPMQLWVLNPTRVRIMMGEGDDLIDGYEYRGMGGIIYFPEDEIIHIRTLRPSDQDIHQLVGIGLVQAAIENANIDAEIKGFLQRYFMNDARPPSVFKTVDEMDTVTWENYKAAWNKQLPNNKLYAILESGTAIENLSGSSIDVDYEKVDRMVRQSIAEIFGLSVTQIEANYGSRATADVVRGMFLTQTINPILRLIDSFYSHHVQKIDPSLIVEHEYYTDKDANEDRLQEVHELTTGQITVNGLRARRNLPPVKDGDTIFVPAGAQTLKKALETPQPIFGNYDGESVKKNNEPDEREIVWRKFDTLTQKKAATLKEVIADVFGMLEKEVIGNIEKSFSGVTKQGVGEGLELFDFEEWVTKIENATGEILSGLQYEAIRKAIEEVNEDLENLPSSFNSQMEKELEKSVSKITESIGTIREEVQDLVKTNTDATASELKDLLTQKFATLKESRADAIAKTSANYTTSAAQSKTWKGLDVTYTWLSQRDGVTRSTHANADGTQPDEKGLFHVGADKMEHPCGGKIAAENVNCRCGLFPMKKKVKE